MKKRRILSILLKCCMLLTMMMPTGVWAGEGGEPALNDVINGVITVGASEVPCTYTVTALPENGKAGEVMIGANNQRAVSQDVSGAVMIPSVCLIGEDPYKVTKIGDNAFLDCGNLTGVLFAEDSNLKEIGVAAFKVCDNLLGSLTLPEGLQTICLEAFYGCYQISELYLPDTLVSIGGRAFYAFTSLDGILELPASLGTIGDYAFEDCSKLDGLRFRDNASPGNIGTQAFYGAKFNTIYVPGNWSGGSSYPLGGRGTFYFNNESQPLKMLKEVSWTAEANGEFGVSNTTCVSITMNHPIAGLEDLDVFSVEDATAAGPLQKIDNLNFVLPVKDITADNMGLVTVNAKPPAGYVFYPETYGVIVYVNDFEAPVITTTELPRTLLNQPYAYTMTATGTAPITWSMTSERMDNYGLTIDASTGSISGAVSSAYGPLEVIITATNVAGSHTLEFPLECYFSQWETPNASVDYDGELLHDLSPGAIYLLNGQTVTADESGAIDISDLLGTTIELVMDRDSFDSMESSPQNITLAGRPDVPSCVAVQPSAGSATGSISGITSEMEYSTNGGLNWISGNGDDATGLVPGVVWIRVKATAEAPASENQVITLETYVSPTLTPTPSPSGNSSSGGNPVSGPVPMPTPVNDTFVFTPRLIQNMQTGNQPINIDNGLQIQADLNAIPRNDGDAIIIKASEIKDTKTLEGFYGAYPDQKALFKGYEVNFSVERNGKDAPITQLAGEITLKFQLTPEELKGIDPNTLSVYKEGESGAVTKLSGIFDRATSTLIVTTDHLCKFYVMAKEGGPVQAFTDVKTSDWFYDAVEYVVSKVLYTGTSEKTFSPNNVMTREMFWTVLGVTTGRLCPEAPCSRMPGIGP